MNDPERDIKENLLYIRSRYYGKFTPEHLAFNANLQEFAQKVAYISGLHTNGKISSEEAYQDLSLLWQQLRRSKETMLGD
jgi:hypothetical protein